MDAEGIPWKTETFFYQPPPSEPEGRSTYALGGLDVLDQHDQLFLADKTLETGVVRVTFILRNDDRSGTLPLNVLCLREEILHQLLLAGELTINMA